MSDIGKSFELYEMMAERFEKSGFAPKQAKIYRETMDFMSDCATLDEAMAKIKSSKYYLAPGAALIEDKLAALERAANEMSMPELAEVYAEKRRSIEEEVTEMYSSEYADKALRIKTAYVRKNEAFIAVFNAYLSLLCAPKEPTEYARLAKELGSAMEEISKQGFDFEALAAERRSRELLAVSDDIYARFMSEAKALCQSPAPPRIEPDEGVWERVKANKQAVTAVGAKCLPKVGEGECVVVPPEDAMGRYSYIDPVKEAL